MYTPKINDAGVWTLLEPYSLLITPSVIYTVRSIRTINDIISSGSDPYETYYKPLGIDDKVYLDDAKKNICIIGLQAGSGEWVYVPETFIKTPPLVDGVKYSSIVLGVGLGAIADALNLEALTGSLEEIVESTLGTKPKIKAVLVSQPVFISHEAHERLELARKAKVSQSQTNYSQLVALKKENELLRLKIKELEKYIKNSL